MAGNRKRVRHYHEPGDVHELTFSCCRRLALLTNDRWCKYPSGSVNDSVRRHRFRLVAFVFMPEHVHLAVLPPDDTPEPDIGAFLAGVKRPCSVKVKRDLLARDRALLKKLTVRERPGKTVFRFWQEGPGYDRNLQTEQSVLAAIDYIHENPVRRGLCRLATEWCWSSARYYAADRQQRDPMLPEIHGLPPEFFVRTTP